MHNVTAPKTYNFKNINYLIGKNGSGKSTVLQAIQLAILGYIPGTDKRVSEIFTHSSSKSMSVDLRLTNDEVVTEGSSECARVLRTWALKGRNIQSNVSTTPEGFDISSHITEIELPIFNFNEFLGLSRNQLKSWFLNFLPEPECKIDWKQEFEKTFLEESFILADPSYLNEVVEEGTVETSGLSGVQQTNANLKEMLSAKKLEVARLQGAVQALIFYDDISYENYEESKSEIIKKLDELRAARNKIADIARNIQSNKKVQERIDKSVSHLIPEDEFEKTTQLFDDSASKYAELHKEYDVLLDELNDIDRNLREACLQIDLKNDIISGEGICPYTKTECESVKNYISQLRSEVENLRANVKEYNSQKAESLAKVREVTDKIEALQDKADKARVEIDNQKIMLSQIQTLKSQFIEISEEDMQLFENSVDDFDERESKLQEELSKLEANHTYEAKINEITSKKYKAENELEALKILIKRTDANNMQTEIAELPFAEFTKKMNEIVPSLFGEDVKFKLNLESKANSFSLGIEKSTYTGDTYIPYYLMSSGEKTLLAFAIMSYIVQMSSSDLKLVMIDDMLDHLDDVNITSLFDKFSEANIQIINAGVKSVDNPEVNIIKI